MQIAAPKCDWSRAPYRDKRRGSLWRCNACGCMAKSKNTPDCPCDPIDLDCPKCSKSRVPVGDGSDARNCACAERATTEARCV